MSAAAGPGARSRHDGGLQEEAGNMLPTTAPISPRDRKLSMERWSSSVSLVGAERLSFRER